MVDHRNSITLIVSLVLLQVACGLSFQYQKGRPSSAWSPAASAWQPIAPPPSKSAQTPSPYWRTQSAGKQEAKGLSARSDTKLPYAPANHRHPVNYYAFRGSNYAGDYGETLPAGEHLYASAAKLSRRRSADFHLTGTNSLGSPVPHSTANRSEVEQLNKALEANTAHQSPQRRLRSQSNDVTGDNVGFNEIAAKATAPISSGPLPQMAAANVASGQSANESSLQQGNHLLGGHDDEDAIGRSLAEWQGRKLKKVKKKLKKLLLPLLIAYKLKFLTLIPVLIGGLTLLVGTTGLAGFFFALFTAVMSLKSSSGHKSIVVKRL